MSFATVVNCMDGRVQLPVITYLKTRFGVDYVDNITESGPDRILARQDDPAIVASILRRIEFSGRKHRSTKLAVVGHADCGGNPASPEEHVQQIRSAVAFLQQQFPNMTVIGLWLNEDWSVTELATQGNA